LDSFAEIVYHTADLTGQQTSGRGTDRDKSSISAANTDG
jgi:hypothetical protein